MRVFLLTLITIYQRYISPYKGFCCAYRVHTGHQSCSQLGFRAIRRFGVQAGFAILRQRTYLCGVVHRRYAISYKRPHRAQRGDCDLGCGGFEGCDFDLPHEKSCDFFGDCCSSSGSCDWPEKKRNKEERYIYIPPNSKN